MERTDLPGPEPLGVGPPPAERADAARNRRLLLATVRAMLAESGPDKVTMDALAERSGLGKGTVYRRFGTRAGIFQALLDDDEHDFQQRVLCGPPPLGPGAPPLDRLVAYGRARIRFLVEHCGIARATLDGRQRVPAQSPLTQTHLRVLLGQLDLGPVDVELLAVQLTGALDGPLLLHLSSADLAEDPDRVERRLADGWHDLVRRACRP